MVHSGVFGTTTALSLRGCEAVSVNFCDGSDWISDCSGLVVTGAPQEGQNREPGASRVPQSEHDGGRATRAPQYSQNTVVAGTGFLHHGQIVCLFFFMPGILMPPLIRLDGSSIVRYLTGG